GGSLPDRTCIRCGARERRGRGAGGSTPSWVAPPGVVRRRWGCSGWGGAPNAPPRPRAGARRAGVQAHGDRRAAVSEPEHRATACLLRGRVVRGASDRTVQGGGAQGNQPNVGDRLRRQQDPLEADCERAGGGERGGGERAQIEGRRLRVNVQLIDAATDAQVWAERYDRTLDDAFAIQSDVAEQIVAAVGSALSGAEQQRLAAA